MQTLSCIWNCADYRPESHTVITAASSCLDSAFRVENAKCDEAHSNSKSIKMHKAFLERVFWKEVEKETAWGTYVYTENVYVYVMVNIC